MKKIVSLLLAVLAVIGLTGCSDGASQNEQEWNDPDFSIETSLNEITFLAPSNWRSKVSEDSNKIYYYPYESNSDGMLYVFYQEVSDANMDDSEEMLNSVLDGMKKSESIRENGFPKKEFTRISNCPAVKAEFLYTINGADYESLIYVFLTNTSVYSVMAAEAGGLSEELEEVAEEFVRNIKVAEDLEETIQPGSETDRPGFENVAKINDQQYEIQSINNIQFEIPCSEQYTWECKEYLLEEVSGLMFRITDNDMGASSDITVTRRGKDKELGEFTLSEKLDLKVSDVYLDREIDVNGCKAWSRVYTMDLTLFYFWCEDTEIEYEDNIYEVSFSVDMKSSLAEHLDASVMRTFTDFILASMKFV